ncbi:hypothetical protein Hte_008037 [Hypoxylon texense]
MEPEVVNDTLAAALPFEMEEPRPPLDCTTVELGVSPPEPTSTDYRYIAHYLLVEQRKSKPGYRSPESKKRNYLLPSKLKKLKINEEKWTFSLHEVAKAFNNLLTQVPLVTVEITLAVLSHAPSTTVDELWCHLHDPKLEGRMKRCFGRRSSKAFQLTTVTWLDIVTRQGSPDYIHLLCRAGLAQEHLSHAFGIALLQHSMEVMSILLSYGAIVSHYQDQIRERIRLKDVALIELLLLYPQAMGIETWRVCVGPEVEALDDYGTEYPNILSICLNRLPEVACESLLFDALKSQNIRAAEILMLSISSDDIDGLHQRACELATCFEDDTRRHECFVTLAKYGYLADRVILREELMKDIEIRHFALVQILVDNGVKLDVEPNNAMYWAMSHVDFEILDLLKDGIFSPPAAPILYYAPDSASERDMLRLIELLEPRGLGGEPLDSHLVRAVLAEQTQLITTLLRLGASVEFDQASSIKAALTLDDFRIFHTLLESKCSPEVLSTVIPMAMSLRPRLKRHSTMAALMKKGVMSSKLGIPLQSLVREDENGDVDWELIRLLLQYQASVDTIGNGIESPISLATRNGNLPLLEMLCRAEPKVDTSSTALPVALGLLDTRSYSTALKAVEILLRQGVAGVLVHKTLLAATEKDGKRQIIRLLLKNGADTNYASGASYGKAVQNGNMKLLEMLCTACPPNQASLESNLSLAVDPRYYKLRGLELLLISNPSATTTINTTWASEDFRKIVRRNVDLVEIVSCFFRHGLDVNLGDGTLLCFAIQEQNVPLLGRILHAIPSPSIASLEHAFKAVILIEDRVKELALMKLLLEQAESVEIGQSQELFTETAVALAGDYAGLQLLLQHRADVNHNDGAAVLAAAVSGSTGVLDLLLLSKPVYATIKAACLRAAETSKLGLDQKLIILIHLVTANGGLAVENASDLLAESIARLPNFPQLPRLLLSRGGTVGFESLLVALGTACQDLLALLLDNIKNPRVAVRLFRAVSGHAISNSRKHWVYQYLLQGPIPINEISEALMAALVVVEDSDLSVPKILLEHGAAVDYGEYAPFSLVLQSNSPEAAKMLCQYLPNDKIADIAFEIARNTASPNKHVRLAAFRGLLQWNISRASVQRALVDILARSSSGDISLVQLLLEKGANPNEEKARCFLIAIRGAAEAEFRALSKYANVPVLLKELLDHFKEEQAIVHWFGICLEEQKEPFNLNQDGLLFTCMRKFPQGCSLLQLLLKNGLSPAAKVEYRVCVDWPAESCTALIWALFSRTPRIENTPILVLLEIGGQSERTRVSAAFGCLLDKSRTPVLEALLDLDRARAMKQKMLGTKFGYLAAYPTKFDDKLSPAHSEIFLKEASMFVGNFEAYQALKCDETPDDGSLHLAAWLALPKFVRWFLRSDDASRGHENFGGAIPLAVACESRPMPWCKIANQEANWNVRLKETMQILAPVTNLAGPRLRHRGMTVLHTAMYNGAEVTNALIDTLKIHNDRERNEKYLYKDIEGLFYSPDKWVEKLHEIDVAEKPALLKSLEAARFQSRYYREVEPGKGEQPEGYSGLPQKYAVLWGEYERMLAEKQKLV